MVGRIALGLVFMMTLLGNVAPAGAQVKPLRDRSQAARNATLEVSYGLTQDAVRQSGTGRIAGLGEFRAAQTWDNRLKFGMATAEFAFERVTSETGETEITIGGTGEDALIIRLGGPDGLSVEKGGRVINVRRGEDTSEAVRRLVGGRALNAFRHRLGQYERQLAAETGWRKKDPMDSYACSFLLTAALIGELAGDPNAIGRTRELIGRRILAAHGRPQPAGFVRRQGEDCWMKYEQALLKNETRANQCMEATASVAWYLRYAEEVLCGVEFVAGALGAESSLITCMGLAGLKLAS